MLTNAINSRFVGKPTKFFKHLWALRNERLLISPKISPNSHPNRDSKGERLPADLAKIKEAPAGLQVSNSAHHGQGFV